MFPVALCARKPKPVVTHVSMCVLLIVLSGTFMPVLPTANCIARNLDSGVLICANPNAITKNQESLYFVMDSCAKNLYKSSVLVDVRRRLVVVGAAL